VQINRANRLQKELEGIRNPPGKAQAEASLQKFLNVFVEQLTEGVGKASNEDVAVHVGEHVFFDEFFGSATVVWVYYPKSNKVMKAFVVAYRAPDGSWVPGKMLLFRPVNLGANNEEGL
jgi:hypothetical protein